MQTRIVTWCVMRRNNKRLLYTFFSRRRAAESFRADDGSLFKVTWRNVDGGTKSVLADVANLVLSSMSDAAKLTKFTSMATWEPI
jgi:hypothetical protein